MNASMEHRGMLLYGVSTESRLTRLETIAEILVTREDLNKNDPYTELLKLRYQLKKGHEEFRAYLRKINAKIDCFMLITIVSWLLGLISFFFAFENSMKTHIESAISRAMLMQSPATTASFNTTIHQPTAP